MKNLIKKNKRIIKYVIMMIVVFTISIGGGYIGASLVKTTTNTSTMNITKTSASSASSNDKTKIINDCANSVVEIRTESVQRGSFMQDAVSEGAGSGVILSEDGYIITNYHVIDGASSIKVTTKDEKEYTAKIIGFDDENDIAVLKIDADDLTVAAIGDSDSLAVGENVYAIGNPLGELGGTVTEGIISATSREVKIDNNSMTLLQTSAAVNAGNSGGGLFNENGELIGIVNAKSSGSDVEGLGFAIPSNTASDIATQIVDNGYVSGKYKLGISLVEIDSESKAQYYGVDKTGIYVSDVSRDSIAESAGFKSGDCIISLNGKKYDNASDITSVVKTSKSGDTLKFIVERDNKEKTITINVD